MELVDEKIKSLQSSEVDQKVSEVLNNAHCRKALKDLHANFVITPIDKATGNVAIICKRFYAMVLVNELGINAISSETYKTLSTPAETIIQAQKKTLKKKFNLEVNSVNECLPQIYWLPKMHKNPAKFRFIIAAPKCAIKPLSKSITAIFKLFYSQIETYNKKSHFYSGIKTFWVVQNNEPVINSIHRLNSRKKGRCMSTFDFSTLYTKIPHHKLITVLNELVDFCFQGGTKKKIAVTKFGAKWVSKNSKCELTFDKKQIKDGIKYLMDNCQFTLGDKVFQQVIGIPMGSDPAPFMANLFLYYYESRWIKELKKKNLIVARKFGNTFRFIDDLMAINDDGEFERNIHDIYPSELELKKEHGGDQVSFLDLDVSLRNKEFSIKLFDKRDAFPFSIVRMPYCSSNMPSNIFYSCIAAEILRIGRPTSHLADFLNSSKCLLKRMFKQGAKVDRVAKVLLKIYGRHEVLHKFAHNARVFANMIMQ